LQQHNPGIRQFSNQPVLYRVAIILTIGHPDFFTLEEGVAAVTGSCFFEYGEGYIRISAWRTDD
jgi:hypothetical protein